MKSACRRDHVHLFGGEPVIGIHIHHVLCKASGKLLHSPYMIPALKISRLHHGSQYLDYGIVALLKLGGLHLQKHQLLVERYLLAVDLGLKARALVVEIYRVSYPCPDDHLIIGLCHKVICPQDIAFSLRDLVVPFRHHYYGQDVRQPFAYHLLYHGKAFGLRICDIDDEHRGSVCRIGDLSYDIVIIIGFHNLILVRNHIRYLFSVFQNLVVD